MNGAEPAHAELPTLAALILFTIASLALGAVANLVGSRKAGFLQKYFLGNRSMGAVAAALTAAVMSGGTFLGFPSLVYSFGWVVGLWICSYMIAPMTVMGLMGKRVGQLARRTGAITLPDLLRERYGSPTLGLLTSLVIILFLSMFMVAQFTAGARIMKVVLPAGIGGGGGAASIARAAEEGVSSEAEPTIGDDPAAAENTARDAADRRAYLLGLLIFTVTVVAYTTYGGFLAAIWTDVFQSLVMAVGVLILLPLTLAAAGGMHQATLAGMNQAGPGFAFGPGAGREFHPITMAFSYFVMWAITGAGQPSTIVRLMAFRDSRTLRYSLIYQTLYNAIVYIPLIFIFVAARSLPLRLSSPDDVMPTLVVTLANPYVAGILMAAPYGAVLSTVSGWLLIISSGLVRDLYQRFLRPAASEREIARASYIGTVLVGLIVAAIAVKPPERLQLIVVFASTGLAAAFLVPAFMGCFWRRASAAGAVAAMVGGAGVTLLLYAIGQGGEAWTNFLGLPPNPPIGPMAKLRPYYLLGFDPCVWGIGVSVLLGVGVSLLTRPPEASRLALLFDAQPPNAPAPATVELHPELGRTLVDEERKP